MVKAQFAFGPFMVRSIYKINVSMANSISLETSNRDYWFWFGGGKEPIRVYVCVCDSHSVFMKVNLINLLTKTTNTMKS